MFDISLCPLNSQESEKKRRKWKNPKGNLPQHRHMMLWAMKMMLQHQRGKKTQNNELKWYVQWGQLNICRIPNSLSILAWILWQESAISVSWIRVSRVCSAAWLDLTLLLHVFWFLCNCNAQSAVPDRLYPYRNFPGENQKLSRVENPTCS